MATNDTYDGTVGLSPSSILQPMSCDFGNPELFKRLKDAHEYNVSLLNRHSDMVSTNRDINSLHHAEAVIESQHLEIIRLTNNIEELNSKLDNNSKLNDQTQNKLLQDIANLNDYIIKLESDLQLSHNKSQTYLNTIKSLEAKIVQMDNLILSKDTDANQSYQINYKLKIRNSELETKYQELLTELYHVKDERDRFSAVQSNAKAPINNTDISCKLKKREDITDLAMHMCQMDDVKKKCIIQLENELLTYKNLCQRKCEEIKQLNDVIEHAKISGTNFNGSNKMVQCLQKQILHLSNDIHMQSKLVQEYQQSLANKQLHQLPSSQSYQYQDFNSSLKIINETQQYELDKAVVTKLLSKIEDVAVRNTMSKSRAQILNPYYTCYVYLYVCQLADYCTYNNIVTDSNTNNVSLEENEYNVNICVCSDKICIFNDERYNIDDSNGRKSEYMELPVNAIESVTSSGNMFKIVTKKNISWVHLHIITKNEDEFNRLYFALCYNGCLSRVLLNGCNVFGGIAQNDCFQLPIILYTKTQEIVGSLFYNNDFNILLVYSTDSKIYPMVISCKDYILNNVNSFDDVAFNYYSMHGKCNIGHLYSLKRFQVDSVVVDAVYHAENNFITASTDQTYYLTSVNETDIQQLDQLLELGEWHEVPSEIEEPPDKQEIENTSEEETINKNESDELFKSSITPFIIRDGYIYFKFVDMANESQGVEIDKCVFIADASKNELAILIKGEVQEHEMFIFSLPTKQDFDYWKNNLVEHGLNEQQNDMNNDDGKFYRSNSGKINQQACVVTKGQMQLFKDYNDDVSEPLITYVSSSTKVSINEEKREIIMESTSTHGNRSRITLDCTNPKEFVRWKSALILAGFISGNSVNSDNINGLKKYVFPIKLFKTSDNNDSGRRAFVIKSNYVALYISSTSKDPYLLFKKADVEVLIFVNDRRIRLYVRRYTKNEERFDFILPLMKDFSTACAEFKSFCYKVSSGEDTLNIVGDKSKIMKNSKFPFVLAKPGAITLHLTMYTSEPEVTIKPSDYSCDIVKNKLKIEFIPKAEGVKNLPPFIFKHDDSFNKWLLTLKISGFLRFTNEKMTRLYFPTIFYGHISPESSMVLNK